MKQYSLFSGTEHEAPNQYRDKGKINFLIFHRENPEIYQSFKNAAFKRIYEESTKKIGGQNIIELIRWGFDQHGKKHVPINNDHVAYYTRIFQQENPKYAKYFEVRRLKNPANEIALTEIV